MRIVFIITQHPVRRAAAPGRQNGYFGGRVVTEPGVVQKALAKGVGAKNRCPCRVSSKLPYPGYWPEWGPLPMLQLR